HPGGFGIRKSASNSGHSPLRGLGGGLGGGLGDASPARRGSRSRTASPPASLAIRKAPSASVESIEPRPPQPCEVGRPKGRRRQSRRQSRSEERRVRRQARQLAATPWGGSAPRPLCQKICYQTAQKSAPCAPASTQEVRNPKIGQPLGAQPTPRFRGMLDALLDAMFDPLPPFTFCCPQAIVDEDAGV